MTQNKTLILALMLCHSELKILNRKIPSGKKFTPALNKKTEDVINELTKTILEADKALKNAEKKNNNKSESSWKTPSEKVSNGTDKLLKEILQGN